VINLFKAELDLLIKAGLNRKNVITHLMKIKRTN